MAFFTDLTPTEHTITDPDSGETATVKIRKLTAGDLAGIQDSIRLSMEGDNPTPEVQIGIFRMMIVEKSLVDWSLDTPVSPNTIRMLNPLVFEQIFALCNEDADAGKKGKSSSKTK